MFRVSYVFNERKWRETYMCVRQGAKEKRKATIVGRISAFGDTIPTTTEHELVDRAF
jgi:hypothetical protein